MAAKTPSASLLYTSITLDAFNKILSRYPSLVPSKLKDLDTLRYETIPAAVEKRKMQENVHLKKEEVVQLVEWKLKHGTFRPSLLSLVQSNPASLIESRTRVAFTQLTPSKKSDLDPLTALLTLSSPPAKDKDKKLKGIGPATASLLLSAFNPAGTPFFSDELFRWVMWEEQKEGWSKPIKYNVKEYEELDSRVKEMRSRLGVRAVDVERVAWVLGREKVEVGAEGALRTVEEWGDVEKKSKGEEGEGKTDSVVKANEVVREKDVLTKNSEQEPENSPNKEQPKPEPKKGTKRKVEDAKSPTEGLRRSSRRKTTDS